MQKRTYLLVFNIFSVNLKLLLILSNYFIVKWECPYIFYFILERMCVQPTFDFIKPVT